MRWTFSRTAGARAVPSRGVIPMTIMYLEPNSFSTRFVTATYGWSCGSIRAGSTMTRSCVIWRPRSAVTAAVSAMTASRHRMTHSA